MRALRHVIRHCLRCCVEAGAGLLAKAAWAVRASDFEWALGGFHDARISGPPQTEAFQVARTLRERHCLLSAAGQPREVPDARQAQQLFVVFDDRSVVEVERVAGGFVELGLDVFEVERFAGDLFELARQVFALLQQDFVGGHLAEFFLRELAQQSFVFAHHAARGLAERRPLTERQARQRLVQLTPERAPAHARQEHREQAHAGRRRSAAALVVRVQQRVSPTRTDEPSADDLLRVVLQVLESALPPLGLRFKSPIQLAVLVIGRCVGLPLLRRSGFFLRHAR